MKRPTFLPAPTPTYHYLPTSYLYRPTYYYFLLGVCPSHQSQPRLLHPLHLTSWSMANRLCLSTTRSSWQRLKKKKSLPRNGVVCCSSALCATASLYANTSRAIFFFFFFFSFFHFAYCRYAMLVPNTPPEIPETGYFALSLIRRAENAQLPQNV